MSGARTQDRLENRESTLMPIAVDMTDRSSGEMQRVTFDRDGEWIVVEIESRSGLEKLVLSFEVETFKKVAMLVVEDILADMRRVQ